MTNQLVQLHYQDHFLDHGFQFGNVREFVSYIASLDLDYIWVFDESTPGAESIATYFPRITFVEEVYK